MKTNKDINKAVESIHAIMDGIKGLDYFEKCKELSNQENMVPMNITNGRGSVFLYDDDFVLKLFSERALREMAVDTPFLKELQGEEFPPVLYGYGHDYVIMENVSEPAVLLLMDEMLKSYGDDKEKGMKAVNEFLDKVIQQFGDSMRIMFNHEILYSDMKLYSHFRWDTDADKIRIIDYGNCVFTRNDDVGPSLMDILKETGSDDDAEGLLKGRHITPKTPEEIEDLVRGRCVFLRYRLLESLEEGRIRD